MQNSGSTKNNFTHPVTYTVIAADNSIKKYIVKVAAAADTAKSLTSFKLSSIGAEGAISETAGTVSVQVPLISILPR